MREQHPTHKRYLAVREFCRNYPVSPVSIYRQVRAGKIAHFRIGRKIIIDTLAVVPQQRASVDPDPARSGDVASGAA